MGTSVLGKNFFCNAGDFITSGRGLLVPLGFETGLYFDGNL